MRFRDPFRFDWSAIHQDQNVETITAKHGDVWRVRAPKLDLIEPMSAFRRGHNTNGIKPPSLPRRDHTIELAAGNCLCAVRRERRCLLRSGQLFRCLPNLFQRDFGFEVLTIDIAICGIRARWLFGERSCGKAKDGAQDKVPHRPNAIARNYPALHWKVP